MEYYQDNSIYNSIQFKKCISLEEKIDYLISLKTEGDFWDYKKEWHEDMDELIKDIVCFVNTPHENDCYIIFGVDNKGNVLGVNESHIKQSDILDKLSTLDFAGDVKPKVSVDTIKLHDVKLDILTIYNENNVPIYLKKSNGKMFANCIYVRIFDRNTPKYKTANIFEIENLWKKRFGLLKPPLEQLFDRLCNKDEWATCYNDSSYIYYNIYKPEFVLEISTENLLRDSSSISYTFAMTNELTLFQELSVKIKETTCMKFQLVGLDSGRLLTPIPSNGKIIIDNKEYFYDYFTENSYDFKIQLFLFNEENMEQWKARRDLYEVVLLFSSTNEKELFENYVKENYKKLNHLIESVKNRYSYIDTGNSYKTMKIKERLWFGLALNALLIDFRS